MAAPDPKDLPKYRKDIEDIAKVTEDTFRSVADNISKTFKDALNEGQSVSKSFGNDIKNNLNSLARIASDSLANQEKLKKGLLTQQDIQKQIQSREAKLLAIQNSIEASRSAGLKVSKQVLEDLERAKDVNEQYTNQLKQQQKLVKDTQDSINKQLGISPKLLGGLDSAMKKMGLPDMGFADSIKKTHELGQAAAANGEKFSAWKTYTKEVGSNLKESLSFSNLLQIGMGTLVGVLKSVDDITGTTAKNMGISYSTALDITETFHSMADSSGDIFVTTKGISESFNQINQALGTNGKLSQDILVTQTELVKKAGYSVEAATMLSKLSLATGKPTKDIAANFLGSAKALNLVNGTAINEKQLLEDVSGLSKDTLATFADQPGKLAEAAYEARKLGLSLEKLKGSQSALLDIESSIANEFEAEVLTGKQLNLEKARYFALTNDYAGLAKELGNQDITRASFAKMNVLQQESVAKALGMSADTMGGMLIDQEAMSKLSGVDGANAKEKFNNLVKQVGMEEAKKRLGDDTLAQQMEGNNVQERFLALTEKLKDAFVGIAGPILEFVSPLIDLASKWMPEIILGMKIYYGLQLLSWGIQKGMAAYDMIKGTSMTEQLATQTVMNTEKEIEAGLTEGIAGANIANELSLGAQEATLPGLIAEQGALATETSITAGAAILAAEASTIGIGTVAIIAGLAAVAAAAGTYFAMKDGVIDPKKGPVVSGGFGSVQLDPNDQIVAGTNLMPKGRSSSPGIDYEKLGTHLANAVSKVQVQTNLDGVAVSRGLQAPMGQATRKI